MGQSEKRWFITGGCGFIGVNLIRVLCERDLVSSIRILDDLSVGCLAAIENFTPVQQVLQPRPMAGDHRVELVRASITADVAPWVEGADVVVHLAANTGVQTSINSPRIDMKSNVFGTFNVLEAARRAGTPRFVFASSGAPTGHVAPPIHEDVPCRPLSPYGASKLAGEGYCSAYFWSYGLGTVSLRFSNVYGPWSTHKGSVVARFIRQAFAGEPWTLNGDGEQTRDFVFIDDLVDAVIAAAEFGGGGEIFQVATGRETSVRKLAELLARELQQQFGIAPQVRLGPPLPGDMPKNFVSIAKARRVLGWAPKWDIEDGVAVIVRWFGQRRQQPLGNFA
jgi:UDP-glucose 4-epimerase